MTGQKSWSVQIFGWFSEATGEVFRVLLVAAGEQEDYRSFFVQTALTSAGVFSQGRRADGLKAIFLLLACCYQEDSKHCHPVRVRCRYHVSTIWAGAIGVLPAGALIAAWILGRRAVRVGPMAARSAKIEKLRVPPALPTAEP